MRASRSRRGRGGWSARRAAARLDSARARGRWRWRSFREGSALGSIDVAILEDDEVVALSTILVVPQGFAASGDAARSLLTLRGLNGARVAARGAAPFAIERHARSEGH